MSVSPEQLIDTAWASLLAGRASEAEAISRRVLQGHPAKGPALQVLGLALHQSGRTAAAIPILEKCVELNPERAEYHSNLALVLGECGRTNEAIALLKRAVELKPNSPEAHNNLGTAFSQLGRLTDAEMAYRRAIELKFEYTDAHNNLGNTLRRMGRLLAAIETHQTALRLRPGDSGVLVGLATALQELGRAGEALRCRRSLAARPDCPAVVHSAFLFSLHSGDAVPREVIFTEHVAWARRHTAALGRRAPTQSYSNDPDPGRPLRVGYVSADFRGHAVGRFVEPVLAAHDRNTVTLICYSNSNVTDQCTARIRDVSVLWRNIVGMADEEVAELIRNDAVDILVDLAGHTAGNRLLVFARKPAPVQVSFLGYPDTTGLTAMDYRITDSVADPPGMTDRFHTEQLIRLDRCAWCHPMPISAPFPSPPPSLVANYITFGTPNRLWKLGPKTVALWAQILRGAPASRLLVLGPQEAVSELRNQFQEQQIERSRIIGYSRGSEKSYWETLQRIDIALDPLAYNGTSTTCDLLWMGVPVISMAGAMHASRVGASLLSACGLSELIAHTPEDYVRIAVRLATDRDRLLSLRRSIRNGIRNSALGNARDLAANIEAAYRKMWVKWCENTRRQT